MHTPYDLIDFPYYSISFKYHGITNKKLSYIQFIQKLINGISMINYLPI
jgi:hypothetical protein